jgi:hypothetical protein
MMCRGVVWRHAVVGALRVMVFGRAAKRTRPGMTKRGPVVLVGLIGIRLLLLLLLLMVVRMLLMLSLLVLMRVLWWIVDMVVRSYSVVARHRVSNAWGPPERAALAGYWEMYGKNL